MISKIADRWSFGMRFPISLLCKDSTSARLDHLPEMSHLHVERGSDQLIELRGHHRPRDLQLSPDDPQHSRAFRDDDRVIPARANWLPEDDGTLLDRCVARMGTTDQSYSWSMYFRTVNMQGYTYSIILWKTWRMYASEIVMFVANRSSFTFASNFMIAPSLFDDF